MKKPTRQTTPPAASVARPRRGRREFYIWSFWFLILVFWDSLLDLLLHGLHIVIEFLELGLEELLEVMFHLEGHESQMFTAWTGLAAFMGLGAFVYVKLVRFVRSRFRSWAYCRFKLMQWVRESWLPLSIFTSAYLATLLFF
jgi:hypothetical protein